MSTATIQFLRLAGRCANGSERDGGRLVHAVTEGRGLCGATPGRRSAGWSSWPAENATCQRCISRLAKALSPGKKPSDKALVRILLVALMLFGVAPAMAGDAEAALVRQQRQIEQIQRELKRQKMELKQQAEELDWQWLEAQWHEMRRQNGDEE